MAEIGEIKINLFFPSCREYRKIGLDLGLNPPICHTMDSYHCKHKLRFGLVLQGFRTHLRSRFLVPEKFRRRYKISRFMFDWLGRGSQGQNSSHTATDPGSTPGNPYGGKAGVQFGRLSGGGRSWVGLGIAR